MKDGNLLRFGEWRRALSWRESDWTRGPSIHWEYQRKLLHPNLFVARLIEALGQFGAKDLF